MVVKFRKMIRKNFYMSQDQSEYLAKMGDVTVSEHLRRAIAEYIDRDQNKNATTSPSKGVSK